MRIFDDVSGIPKVENTVLTLGTFDGIHLGHKKIIDKLKKRAATVKGRSLLITFNPHPRKIINTGNGIKLITTNDEKIKLISELGVENLLLINFTKEFSQLTSEEFIKNYVIDKIGLKEIVIGYDHHFGKGRSGDVNTLRKLAVHYDFDVTMVEALKVNNENVNSTAIRKALQEGNIKKVNQFLGRKYSFNGLVVEGDKRGRTLGFPTANIDINDQDKLLPCFGIYAVNIFVDGQKYNGLMSIGIRPTFFSEGSMVVEVYIYDFNMEIYGSEVTVEVVDWIRGEEKFSSADDLVDQMQRDKEKGIEIFKKVI